MGCCNQRTYTTAPSDSFPGLLRGDQGAWPARTAWSDKHPAYEILNGPSGTGVNDLYPPEINAYFPGSGTKDNTGSFTAIQRYDATKRRRAGRSISPTTRPWPGSTRRLGRRTLPQRRHAGQQPGADPFLDPAVVQAEGATVLPGLFPAQP